MPGRKTRRGVGALALATAGAALAIAGPGAAPASANACSAHGNKLPEELTVQQAQKAIRCLINKERGANLGRDGRLENAAQYHSRYMRNHTCFDHQCAGEKSLEKRLRKFNYLIGGLSFWMYGENIAYGLRNDGTPKNIVQGWMRSPGHRANILNSRFRDLGVGFMHGTPSNPDAPGGIYTTDFGIRRG